MIVRVQGPIASAAASTSENQPSSAISTPSGRMAPSLIAREARSLGGSDRRRALDAYARARETSRLAPRLSLDAAATVFQLGTILASVAPAAGRG